MRYRAYLNPKSAIAALLVLIVITQWSGAAWIYTKAHVAQWLIASAWENTLNLHQAIKPWRWADTWPVARLQWQPSKQQTAKNDLYVLHGVHGQALAFGPGLMYEAGQPGQGPAILAGHRDTHFRFLEDVEPKDTLRIQTKDGLWHEYQVDFTEVRHIQNDPLIPSDSDKLLLITCYPFDAINTGGPLRYVVSASPVGARLASHETPKNLVF